MKFPEVLRRNSKLTVVLFVLIGIVILGVYTAITSSEVRKKVLPASTKSEKMTEKETKSLTEKIGKIIELPKSEVPTVATVKNKFDLPPQPFYRYAENGDIVLLYLKTGKAYLYRPSKHKIIEVAPITIPSPSASVPMQSTSPQPSSSGTRTQYRIQSSPKLLKPE